MAYSAMDSVHHSSGPCRAGFVCPADEVRTTATHKTCAQSREFYWFSGEIGISRIRTAINESFLPNGVFCPEGSRIATVVNDGRALMTIPRAAHGTRTGEVPCIAGHACFHGIPSPCPPGRFSTGEQEMRDLSRFGQGSAELVSPDCSPCRCVITLHHQEISSLKLSSSCTA